MKKSKVKIYSVCALLTLCSLSSCNNETNPGSNTEPKDTTDTSQITEENKKYNVSYEQGKGYTISGLESGGYKKGDTVTFIVNVTDSSKSIEKVTVDGAELNETSGSYSFMMPGKNVSIVVTLTDVKVTSISLNKTEVTLNLDDHSEETLQVSFLPTGSNGEIVWDSSDPTVASIENGKITALKEGTSTITAKLLSDFKIKGTCLVTVESNFVGYTFEAIDAEVSSGEKNLRENIVGFGDGDNSVNIKYVIEAEKESNFELGVNISSNTAQYKLTDVFSISLNETKITSDVYTKLGTCWSDYSEISLGIFHLNQGENTINISFDKSLTDWQTFNFKSLELHAPQTLTFKNKNTPARIESIQFEQHEMSVEFEANKTFKLNANVTPAEASSKYIKWESSDTGVATVDKEGNITLKGIGNATITAKCEYNLEIQDSCILNVTTKQNTYAFNAIDEKVLVDKGSKNANENCVGVDSSYSSHIVYTFDSDREGAISLSAVISSHSAPRRFTDVFALSINGVTQTSDGVIPVGEMWAGYTSVLLGSFDFVKGTNTIELTYLQQALTWQSYNFRSLGITSDNVITLIETPRPAEKHTLNILANDQKVATNGNLDGEGAIGAIGYDTVKMITKVNSSKAAKATLKAALSSSPDGRAISSIYNLKVNGVSVVPQGNFSVGNQWGSYVEYTLGEIDLIEGENTIEFSYDWNISPGWTYNYKGISLESEATLTLLDANGPIENIALDKTEATIKAGSELQLTATINPDTVLNKKVTWSSNNEEVATVDKNGKVTAITAGIAEISATYGLDNTKKATCIITVEGTTNNYTFNAVDENVLVDIGQKNIEQNCVGTDSSYHAHVLYKFNSDKAGTIKLSSTVSCHNASRAYTDVYEIKINGVAISSSAVVPVGEMWKQYVQLLLGEYSVVAGENTIEVTYKQEALNWMTYNFRDIQIITECTLELVNANS